MKIIRRPSASLSLPASALTIGNFDGVHSGHVALFREVVAAAKAHQLVPTVVTFNPHPREFFTPHYKLPRITTFRDRLAAMKQCGIEQVVVLPFHHTLANQAPDAFVQHVLCEQLQARQVWVGDNFRFGAQRAGDLTLLKNLAPLYNFTIHGLPQVQVDGHRVSSSGIREALHAGNIALATRMLGRPLSFSGHVIHGKKLGRTLGFPTLNLLIRGRACALSGVLAVRVHGLSDHPLPAVASLGVRPTTEQSDQILLETFIPNWTGNAYGQRILIEVVHHLRKEHHFLRLEDMIEQMHQDTRQALALLESTPVSPKLGVSSTF